MHQKLAIVGCGVIGLTTALEIQRKFPNSDITIFTKEVSPYTTSDIAAGLWEPIFLRDTPEDKIAYWSQETYDQLLKWFKEGKSRKYGVCLQPTIFLTDSDDLKLPKWLDCTLGYHLLPKDILAKLSKKCDVRLTSGIYFTTFTWEGGLFLRTLQKEFTDNGGKIVIKDLKCLTELADFDVIINCAGLGARELLGDYELVPIRGQIKKVKAPWLYEACILNSSSKIAYVIPNTYLCTLGGTANYDDGNINVSDDDNKEIERNCNQLYPSLKSAKFVRDAVGLRPGRSKVRLGIETIQSGDKQLKVIHNYGHGGSGLTLAIGCAKEATLLLQSILTSSKL